MSDRVSWKLYLRSFPVSIFSHQKTSSFIRWKLMNTCYASLKSMEQQPQQQQQIIISFLRIVHSNTWWSRGLGKGGGSKGVQYIHCSRTIPQQLTKSEKSVILKQEWGYKRRAGEGGFCHLFCLWLPHFCPYPSIISPFNNLVLTTCYAR